MQENEKPFSPSCERNKDPILNILKQYLEDGDSVFEVGSGTAQHAVYFIQNLPIKQWTTSDQPQYHDGIVQWLREFNNDKIEGPKTYTIGKDQIPIVNENVLFSANTLHIMSAACVEKLILDLGQKKSIEQFFYYGPFNYNNQFTSQSNQNFDLMLKQRDPKSGIRDLGWVTELMNKQGFGLIQDHEMPANNRLILWQRL